MPLRGMGRMMIPGVLLRCTPAIHVLPLRGSSIGGARCRNGNTTAGFSKAIGPLSAGISWSGLLHGSAILLGLAVLAKGPIGFLLPAAAIGLFLLSRELIRRHPARRPARERLTSLARFGLVLTHALRKLRDVPLRIARVTWAMRPLTVVAFTALVALPWYVAIYVKTNGAWLEEFVNKYNLGPFIHPFLGHRGPFYYHFVVVLVGLFPWSVFLGPTIVIRLGAQGSGLAARTGRPTCSWSAGSASSLASGRCAARSCRITSCRPTRALAILTGCFLQAWIERAEAAARHVMPIATSIFLGVGVAMLAVLPWVAAATLPASRSLPWSDYAQPAGGILCWRLMARGRRRSYLAVFATASVLFIATVFGWAAVRIDRHQHSRPLMEEVRRDSPAEPQIAGFKYCDASTVYYARGPIVECNDAGKLNEFLARSPHAYVVTTGDELQNLETSMPGQWRIVARRPRFLAKGEIVVVAPQSQVRASVSQRGNEGKRF